MPDTIWFPEDALTHLPGHLLSFLLFPVERPELFDAVVLDDTESVREIRVKRPVRVTVEDGTGILAESAEEIAGAIGKLVRFRVSIAGGLLKAGSIRMTWCRAISRCGIRWRGIRVLKSRARTD